MAWDWEPGVFDVPEDDFWAYLEQKGTVIVSENVYNGRMGAGYDKALRDYSFTAMQLQDIEMIEGVYVALKKAAEQGLTISDFMLYIDTVFDAMNWDTPNPATLETIYRTNIQSAYNAARYQWQKSTTEALPYWLFSAILDSRTTPTCRTLDGVILPANDPRWSKIYPPLHPRCRSEVVALLPEDMDDLGIDLHEGALPSVAISKGFGGPPQIGNIQDYVSTRVQEIQHKLEEAIT